MSYVRVDSKQGSYFTFNFLEALNFVLDKPLKDENVTWNFILEYAREKTIEDTQKGVNAGAYKNVQHPIYDISINY